MTEAKTLTIFGCCGYIGSSATEYFLKKGYRVIGIDLLIYNNANVATHLETYDNFEFYHGSLGDLTLLERLPDSDVVINLAALVGGPATEKYPELATKINVVETKINVDFYSKKPVIYLFTSTCSNYGTTDTLADETSALLPITPYALQKVEIEKYISSITNAVFSPTILRFATAFGVSRRMRRDLLINQFVYDAVNSTPITIYGANAWRPFCAVDDFSKVFEALLTAPDKCNGQIFNVGSDQNNLTKSQVISIITSKLEISTNLFKTNDAVDPRDYRVNFLKFNSIFPGIQYRSVEQSVEEMINYYHQTPSVFSTNEEICFS